MFVTVMIISACLSNSPTECKEFRTPLAENVSTTQCVMGAPAQIAKWAEQNPIWAFKRLKCESEPLNSDGSPILKQDI